MMQDREEFITEIMDLSRDNCDDIEALEEMDAILTQSYGLSYEQYANIRNALLLKYNYALPVDVLRIAITNKITIDLVSKGLLEVESTVNEDIMFKISDKGAKTLHQAMKDGTLKNIKPGPFYALMFLRNSKILKVD